MHRGLTMDLAERQRRWEALRELVWSTTATQYCTAFLTDLERAPGREPRVVLRAAS